MASTACSWLPSTREHSERVRYCQSRSIDTSESGARLVRRGGATSKSFEAERFCRRPKKASLCVCGWVLLFQTDVFDGADERKPSQNKERDHASAKFVLKTKQCGDGLPAKTAVQCWPKISGVCRSHFRAEVRKLNLRSHWIRERGSQFLATMMAAGFVSETANTISDHAPNSCLRLASKQQKQQQQQQLSSASAATDLIKSNKCWFDHNRV